MTFNICMGGEERFPRILEQIRRLSPDLLVLQECLDWEDGQRLAATAEAMGAQFSHLGRSSPRGTGLRYNVAVLSRFPVESCVTHADPHFQAHCVVELQLRVGQEALTVLGTHFVYASENLRFVEAAALLAKLPRPPQFKRGNYLLLGDLNALSRRDPYPRELGERLRQARVRKYHLPPRFEVMQHLEDYGWVDTLYAHGTPSTWVTAPRQYGSALHVDYRNDYVLASPPLIGRLRQAWIVPLTDKESDHFPMVAEFTL